jgi:hypothetical protein
MALLEKFTRDSVRLDLRLEWRAELHGSGALAWVKAVLPTSALAPKDTWPARAIIACSESRKASRQADALDGDGLPERVALPRAVGVAAYLI